MSFLALELARRGIPIPIIISNNPWILGIGIGIVVIALIVRASRNNNQGGDQ